MVNLGSQRSTVSSHNFLSSYPLTHKTEALGNYRTTNDGEEALVRPTYGLECLGIYNIGWIYRNLSVAQLVEQAIMRGEGTLADNGALIVETGKYTGRSPKDRFIVQESISQGEIDWNQHNVAISEDKFNQLYLKVIAYLQGKDLYIFDGYVGADNNYRCGVRIINELASQNLFAHQLFIRPSPQELNNHQADFTVISVPGLQGNPGTDGIHSEAFIVVHLQKRLVIIGGSRYAGEIKKSVFLMMNYFMTKRNVLPMHCAANIDKHAHTTLFFGLSGTGKTTLSADPDCSLIGDDEHGWSANGIFNFEGGCYAKTIRLSQENEPQIWSAIRFGTLLENVIFDPETQIPDYDDGRLTENTRAAYPLLYIPNCSTWGVGSHPKTIFFLTADAFGVLPPIAKLTKDQAMYHFLAGYTSKLAGTERDINAPQATFSACFGQCFFPLSPLVYAKILGERLEQHEDSQVFLINTGWSGGPYGVGHRISIKHTRAMVSAALNGQLNTVNYHCHPIFKVLIPEHIVGVPDTILDPENTWPDQEAYQQQALELAHLFEQNFQQFKEVPPEIIAAGPVPILA